MSLWECPLTDRRSTRVRFVLSLVWSLPLLVPVWFFQRSLADLVIIASAFCFMSVSELLLDLKLLSAVGLSLRYERLWRGVTAVIASLGIVIAICLKG